MSFCRDQHRHNYGAKRCPFFHFFAKRTKKDQKQDQTTKKVDSSYDLMISFFILTRTLTRNTNRGGGRQRRRRRRRRRERNNSAALYSSFIVLSHLLKQISSSLEVVVFYDSVKARTFFSSVAPKVTYRFGAFFDTKFNDNKNNNHYNHKR